MENSSNIATTTISATQNSTDKLFGYSSVLSKESTKVKSFNVLDSQTKGIKIAQWTIEQNKELESYKCEYDTNLEYQHGTVGRYLQSVHKHSNEMLHSFGNSPAISVYDVATVFNIPLQFLQNPNASIEVAELISNFASNDKADVAEVRNLLKSLEEYGLVIDEQNQYASKIQSLTSLQKSYVYFKDKSTPRTTKSKWTDTSDIVLYCKFASETEKKSYAHTIESIISDSIKRIKSNEKKSAKMSSFETFDEKKAFLFAEIESNLKHYLSTALSVKVSIVEKENQTFNLDELL